MAAKYSDDEITALINERKPLPPDYLSRLQLREKRGHKERELDMIGGNGNQFRLILRESGYNPLDFSVILAFCPAETTQVFRLRRYNGKSHEHTNHIEGNTFYDFHVHVATERYQELGAQEDTFAHPSESFADFQGALNCMFQECGFDIPAVPDDRQFRLEGM
jgi:hypothetical protein